MDSFAEYRFFLSGEQRTAACSKNMKNYIKRSGKNIISLKSSFFAALKLALVSNCGWH